MCLKQLNNISTMYIMSQQKICKFYMESNCKKGNSCKFLHDPNHCKHFYLGNCKFGNKCKKIHKFTANNKKNNRKKNTRSFKPDISEPDVRVLIQVSGDKFKGNMKENDVVILPEFFKEDSNQDSNQDSNHDSNHDSIYNKLMTEMNNCGVAPDELWKLWHGDTHFIADDRLAKKLGFDWKSKCPTFNMVIEKMKSFFDMDVKATRFNLYKDNSEWKPYHHDAAAIDARKAKTQNFTVGVTFGCTRTASFQHSKTKTRVDFPLVNGSVYTFAKQVNIDWMHGIVQEPKVKKEGRISIILWGKNNQLKN